MSAKIKRLICTLEESCQQTHQTNYVKTNDYLQKKSNTVVAVTNQLTN